MARSCTTTAYGWLSLDSPPSLKTLWSAVIKSPNFSARSRVSPMRLLQEDFVIRFSSKRRNFLQIRSFGKWVSMMCFLDSDTTFVGCPESESWETCAGVCTYVASRLSVKSSNQIGRSANGSSASFLSSVKDSWPNLLVASSPLRSNTEPEDELDAAQFPETKVHPIPTIPVVAK